MGAGLDAARRRQLAEAGRPRHPVSGFAARGHDDGGVSQPARGPSASLRARRAGERARPQGDHYEGQWRNPNPPPVTR